MTVSAFNKLPIKQKNMYCGLNTQLDRLPSDRFVYIIAHTDLPHIFCACVSPCPAYLPSMPIILRENGHPNAAFKPVRHFVIPCASWYQGPSKSIKPSKQHNRSASYKSITMRFIMLSVLILLQHQGLQHPRYYPFSAVAFLLLLLYCISASSQT